MHLEGVLFASFASIYLISLTLSYLRFYFASRLIRERKLLSSYIESDLTFVTLRSISNSTKYMTLFISVIVIVRFFIIYF